MFYSLFVIYFFTIRSFDAQTPTDRPTELSEYALAILITNKCKQNKSITVNTIFDMRTNIDVVG